MAQKPKNVVRCMERNSDRFYLAADVQELAQLIASRNPGTVSVFKPLLQASIDAKRIVKVRNAAGQWGFASAEGTNSAMRSQAARSSKDMSRLVMV